jgi:hypothetical protein
MLLEDFLSFLLKLFFKLSNLSLLANGRFEFRLFCSGLLFEHFLLFHLLLCTGDFEFCSLLCSDFCLLSLFLTGCSFISFNSSFGPQSIKLGLSV